MSLPGMSRMVDQLVRRRLLVRAVASGDREKSGVSLTPEGVDLSCTANAPVTQFRASSNRSVRTSRLHSCRVGAFESVCSPRRGNRESADHADDNAIRRNEWLREDTEITGPTPCKVRSKGPWKTIPIVSVSPWNRLNADVKAAYALAFPNLSLQKQCAVHHLGSR